MSRVFKKRGLVVVAAVFAMLFFSLSTQIFPVTSNLIAFILAGTSFVAVVLTIIPKTTRVGVFAFLLTMAFLAVWVAIDFLRGGELGQIMNLLIMIAGFAAGLFLLLAGILILPRKTLGAAKVFLVFGSLFLMAFSGLIFARFYVMGVLFGEASDTALVVGILLIILAGLEFGALFFSAFFLFITALACIRKNKGGNVKEVKAAEKEAELVAAKKVPAARSNYAIDNYHYKGEHMSPRFDEVVKRLARVMIARNEGRIDDREYESRKVSILADLWR